MHLNFKTWVIVIVIACVIALMFGVGATRATCPPGTFDDWPVCSPIEDATQLTTTTSDVTQTTTTLPDVTQSTTIPDETQTTTTTPDETETTTTDVTQTTVACDVTTSPDCTPDETETTTTDVTQTTKPDVTQTTKPVTTFPNESPPLTIPEGPDAYPCNGNVCDATHPVYYQPLACIDRTTTLIPQGGWHVPEVRGAGDGSVVINGENCVVNRVSASAPAPTQQSLPQTGLSITKILFWAAVSILIGLVIRRLAGIKDNDEEAA